METKQAVLPLSAPVSTSILLCFGNRHNHITVFDETIFVSSMTLYLQAVHSCAQMQILRCKMLVGKSQTLSDTGEVAEGAAHADLTVIFDSYKPLHMAEASAPLCGKIICADIGIRDEWHPEF